MLYQRSAQARGVVATCTQRSPRWRPAPRAPSRSPPPFLVQVGRFLSHGRHPGGVERRMVSSDGYWRNRAFGRTEIKRPVWGWFINGALRAASCLPAWEVQTHCGTYWYEVSFPGGNMAPACSVTPKNVSKLQCDIELARFLLMCGIAPNGKEVFFFVCSKWAINPDRIEVLLQAPAARSGGLRLPGRSGPILQCGWLRNPFAPKKLWKDSIPLQIPTKNGSTKAPTWGMSFFEGRNTTVETPTSSNTRVSGLRLR